MILRALAWGLLEASSPLMVSVTILLICWILPDSDSFVELSFCMKVTAEIVEFSYYVFIRLLSVTR